MSWVAVAVSGAAIVGGAMQADAAGDAASMQAGAADRASALQLRMFNQQRDDQQPWRQAGNQALAGLMQGMGHTYQAAPALTDQETARMSHLSSRLKELKGYTAMGNKWDSTYDKLKKELGGLQQKQKAFNANVDAPTTGVGDFTRDFTMSDFQKDPGYDFRIAEGQKAIERSAAARGGLNSGATLKSLTRFGQGAASDEYQNAYNRFNSDRDRRFNRLSSIAGVGQTANSQIASAGQNYANQVGQNMMGAANANAAGQIGQANAVSNMIGTGANTWMQYQMMNRAFPKTGA